VKYSVKYKSDMFL